MKFFEDFEMINTSREEIYEFEYNNKIYKFKKPLHIKNWVSVNSKWYEIYIEEFDNLEYGESYKEVYNEVLLNIIDTIDFIYHSEYKNKLSKGTLEIKDFFDKNLIIIDKK